MDTNQEFIPPFKLDGVLAHEIQDTVKKHFLTMFKVDVVANEHLLKVRPTIKADISGMVGMVQEHTEGLLIVGFEKQVILDLASRVFKVKFDDINSQVRDGVKEITNVIYGTTKKYLNDRGFIFRQAIPSVVLGDGDPVSKFFNGHTLVIPFSIQAGLFYVEIAVQRRS